MTRYYCVTVIRQRNDQAEIRFAFFSGGIVFSKRAAVSCFFTLIEGLLERPLTSKEKDDCIVDKPATPDNQAWFQGDYEVYLEADTPEEDTYWTLQLDEYEGEL